MEWVAWDVQCLVHQVGLWGKRAGRGSSSTGLGGRATAGLLAMGPKLRPWSTARWMSQSVLQPSQQKWASSMDRGIILKDRGTGVLTWLYNPEFLNQLPYYVTDVKDCFFGIYLHDGGCKHFAFSVPTVNCQAPMKRYEWVVLPQGMRNSPTICQFVVGSALKPPGNAWGGKLQRI